MKWTGQTAIVLTFSFLSLAQAADDRKQAPDLFEEGKTLAKQENWESATSHFQNFYAQHPDDRRASEARYWAGFCLVKCDEFEEAVRELEQFNSKLAEDPWADDALLQLGHAYLGDEQNARAIETWKGLLKKYPNSPCRTEAAAEIIDLLYAEKDYAGCLPFCEQIVRETADRDAIAEPRYMGAYCLNALGRNDEADRWMDRWFAADDASEAAWRQILKAQRALRQGKTTEALASIEALDTDFADLDKDDRLDLTLRAVTMLTRENQPGRARDLILATLKRPIGCSEDNVNSLLDLLEETATGDDSYVSALERLSGDASLPLMVRVVVRDHRVNSLRETEHSDQAESLLRDVINKETSEYAKSRAAIALAEVLDDEREDRQEALETLKDVLGKLRRTDLVHQVRKAIEDLEKSPE